MKEPVSQKPATGAVPPLDQLEAAMPVARHDGRNMSKASVLFFGRPGDGVALKTYRENNIVARNLAGRSLIAREDAAYRAIGSAEGLPRFLGRVGPFALATEWLDATPLAERRGQVVDDEVFDRIEGIVEMAHQRGVAFGDLHHRDVLLGSAGQVWIIDLAAALVLGARPGRWRRRLFDRLLESDIVNLTRMRARFTGRDVGEALAGLDAGVVARYRRGKRIKAAWDRLRGKRQRQGPFRSHT